MTYLHIPLTLRVPIECHVVSFSKLTVNKLRIKASQYLTLLRPSVLVKLESFDDYNFMLESSKEQPSSLQIQWITINKSNIRKLTL